MTRRPLTDLENANFRIGVLSDMIDRLANVFFGDPNRAARYGWDGIEEKAIEVVENRKPNLDRLTVGRAACRAAVKVYELSHENMGDLRQDYCWIGMDKIEEVVLAEFAGEDAEPKGLDWVSGKTTPIEDLEKGVEMIREQGKASPQAELYSHGQVLSLCEMKTSALRERIDELSNRNDLQAETFQALMQLLGSVKSIRDIPDKVEALQHENEGLTASMEAEEKAATQSGGILSNVCDILFEDPERAATHGYEGVEDKARQLIKALYGQCTKDMANAFRDVFGKEYVERKPEGEINCENKRLKDGHKAAAERAARAIYNSYSTKTETDKPYYDRRIEFIGPPEFHITVWTEKILAEINRQSLDKALREIKTAPKDEQIPVILGMDGGQKLQTEDLASNHSVHSPEDREPEPKPPVWSTATPEEVVKDFERLPELLRKQENDRYEPMWIPPTEAETRGYAIFSVRGHKIKIDEEGIIWLSDDMISWKYLCRITDE